jgi:ubiquinone/menaquinone biosynthesis C-methylase UbiE
MLRVINSQENEKGTMNERRYDAGIARLRSPERMERLEVKRVVDLCLDDPDIASVLDVGTGSGIFAEAFSERVAKVAGIDVNPEMIEASRELVPKASFQQAAAEAIPFPDKSFDLVFLGVVLHEADDVQKALSEALRCAKRRVVVLEWNYRQEDFGPPLEHRLKPEDVAAMAKKAGSKAITITPLRSLLLYQFEV